MGGNKRKRPHKPKTSAPETLDHPTPAPSPAPVTATATAVTAPNSASNAASMEDVFSVSNVELIDNTASPRVRRHRGRPKKLPVHSDKPLSLATGRRLSRPLDKGDGDFSVPSDAGMSTLVAMDVDKGWEARVLPAMDSVVKVFCVHTEPNFSLPWQRKRQYSSSSSGFVIGGRRVLTNAHSVEHYTQVKLKKRGSDTKYLATVLAIGTECDIGN